ncbi:PP2C family protein-serine/threonine phosphatase [Bernardetia sp. OM2101]|uniref:PP2C family protein-serine/threonine phosphatase n=1 Tax=Bernardetia sp. OM2101 TaxID=3344876 RepID=UPI0035CFF881
MVDSIPFLRIPKKLPPEKHRDFAILTIVGILGFSAHLIFLICFLIFGVYSLAYFNVASCFVFAVIFMANRKIDSNASILLTVAIGEIILHAIFSVVIIGWESNFHYYLFLAMMTSFLTGRFGKKSYVTNGIAFLSYLGLYFYTSYLPPLQEVSEIGLFTFGIMNLISSGIMVVTITAYFNYVAGESAKKYIASNTELSQHTEELKTQSEKLSKANTHTMDSIKYALRIQEAMLPSSKELTTIFGVANYMVFYSPKDIISGDFYWCKEIQNKKIIVVGDCTGHGVPGAMLTMIGESLLNTIIEKGIVQPALILDALQSYFSELFISREDVRDGMDISICTIDNEENKVLFAGARNVLTYIQNDKISVIKGDRMSIGQTFTKKFAARDFTNHKIDVPVPTTFYMYSDGYQDQFGGKNDTKFYSKNLRNLLLEIHQQPMRKQRLILKRTLFKWRNLKKQTDDVTVIGFKINPNESLENTRSIEEEIFETQYTNDELNNKVIQKQLEIDSKN